MRPLKHPLRKAIGLAVVVTAWAICAQVAAAAPLIPGQVLAGIGGGTINQFTPTGTLTGTLSTGLGNTFDTGMCFNAAGDLIGTNFDATATRWDATGAIVLPNPFLSGGSVLESCTLDSSGNIFTGQPFSGMNEFNSSGALINTFSGTFPGGTGGTDWVDLSKDEKTMLISNESGTIFRFDVVANAQLADFATGLTGPCFALRIRSNGEVMVACQTLVYRLDASGAVLQTYTMPGSSFLFALNLDPDGATFWTADTNGTIYRVDIATGVIGTTFVSNTTGGLFGLAVVGELRAAVDTTSPTCTLTATLSGPPKEIQVTVQDTGSGLGSIVPTSVNATVTLPVFTVGTTAAQLVTADKTNPLLSSSLSLTVTDAAGNVTHCDPVFGLSRSKTVHGGGSSGGVVRFAHLLQSESKVTLQGASLGVRAVDLIVNGRLFHVSGLAIGRTTKLDIASAMRAGSKNVVVAKVHGGRGATVNIVISD